VVKHAVEAARAGRATSFRGFCPTAKGVGKWWDTSVVPIRGADGQIDWILATSRDITAEIETSAFLQTIVNLLPVSLMVKSASDGRYVLINRAAEAMLGVKADEFLGHCVAELFPPSVAAAFAAEDAEVIASGQVKATVEEPVVMTDGELRYFDTKKVATHGENGARHIVAVAEDVTDRRERSLALKAALAQAEQASQAKLSFLANMSHEIRTPLNGVIGLSDSLGRAKLAPAERQLAAMVKTSAQSLQSLLNDVLDVASLDAGDLAIQVRAFELGPCIQATAIPWRRLARAKGLRLTSHVDAGGLVMGDEARVSQIISNLLSNAVKFTQAGKITLQATTSGAICRIMVADTGVGIPADKTAEIFERFKQADDSSTRRYGGAGLGLPFARDLAERMNAKLDYESRPGEGSRFWLDLPAAAIDASQQAEAGEETRPLRFLVADDHPTNRLVLETILRPLGEVISVENGQQALDAFDGHVFDAILMDLQMPVMDGLTAIGRIRAIEEQGGRGRTPIIVVSASALAEHVTIARAAGADRHLAKPVQFDTLLGELQACLNLAETPG
jgi:PAS domain S-box-containing protein